MLDKVYINSAQTGGEAVFTHKLKEYLAVVEDVRESDVEIHWIDGSGNQKMVPVPVDIGDQSELFEDKNYSKITKLMLEKAVENFTSGDVGR